MRRLTLFLIIVIIGAAFINALVEGNVIDLFGSKVTDEENFENIKKELQKANIEKRKYGKEELIETLVKLDFEIAVEGNLTTATSDNNKGDLSVIITATDDKIETLRIQARKRESKKYHDEINNLYLKEIYKATGLDEDWLESARERLVKFGAAESVSIDETLNGNLASFGYNKGLDSFVFNVDFTN